MIPRPDHSGTADCHTAAQLTPLGRAKRAPVHRNVSVKETQQGVNMNLYIGNLSHEATEADVKQAFEAFG